MAKRKAEYTEGPEAAENFTRLARAVFQAPKTIAVKKRAKRQPVKATARKTHGKNKG